MKSIKTLTLLVIITEMILGCAANGRDKVASSQSQSLVQRQSPELENCVRRGVAYFKEIGSYPKLFSLPDKGRYADDVARERCNRTLRAFP